MILTYYILILSYALLTYGTVSAVVTPSQRLISFLISQQTKRYFKFERHSLCTNDTDTPLKLDNYTVLFADNQMVFSAHGALTRDLIEPMRAELHAERCDLQRDYCTEFGEMSVKNLCDRLKVSTYVQAFRDKVRPYVAACPITAGTYELTNYTLNLNALQSLPLDGHRWVVSIDVYDQSNSISRTQVFCMKAHFRIMVASNRRRRP